MKHLFRQTPETKGYCTILTFANVFRDDFFLKHLENEKFKSGCNDEDEKEILLDFDSNISITSICHSHASYKIPLPKNFILNILSNTDADLADEEVDICLIPYILNVRIIEAYHHTVAVLKYNSKLLYSDPYRESYILIDDWKDLFNYFIDCWEIKRLSVRDKEKFAIIKGELLGYDFLKEIPANSYEKNA